MQTITRSHPPARCARAGTLFVGIDVHKDTHTAVGLSPFGEKIFEMTIGNEADDFISLVEKTKVEANKIGLCVSCSFSPRYATRAVCSLRAPWRPGCLM